MAKQKGKGRRAGLTAARADKYRLYQWSVQSPEEDIAFAVDVYKDMTGKQPRHLREDFCGTAYLASRWVKRGARFTAEGFDLDPEPVRWGLEHNFKPLGKAAAGRAALHVADVREPSRKRPDLRCAQNFSWFVFKTRDELLEYFECAYEDLADDGVFLLDLFGGPQAVEEMQEETEMEQGFTYVWEQREYWPVTGEYSAHIHFEFEDGSALSEAFSYDWRLWSLPEAIDALYEVGFGTVEVYWEQVGADGIHGGGEYALTELGENWLSYVAYLACQK